MTKRMATMDGNEAAAHIAYQFSEIAAIYPITPSSPMAEKTDVWAANGRRNMFGQTVTLVEMQSEAGAIGTVHGALQTGSLATSYTSSQGLMLMIPVMHRISGELLPGVLHVASRTVGTHALSIFGDHSDVMNCRQTGFAMLSTGSVQEILDLAGIAHLAALKGRVPFMHFFDGFRTSHEINKVELLEPGALTALLDREALAAFRARSLNPEHPKLRATVQNGDIYFQVREASQPFYDRLPGLVADYMRQISELTGRSYRLFDYYGDPLATDVVVAMGSVSGTIREAVDYLRRDGRRVGFVQVRLFRPFAAEYLLEVLPSTVRRITVLDRCKEMGSAGEPLYQDVCTVFQSRQLPMEIIGGRYGLSSKDTHPAQIVAVYENMAGKEPIQSFSLGITDDVNQRSLPYVEIMDIGDPGLINCKFWGLGGDGTVGANNNTVKIINEQTELYGQAYFEYDAKKSYGITKSHLRFGKTPVRGSYYVRQADFLACHNETYMDQFDLISEIKPGGTLLLNCSWQPEELAVRLSVDVRRELARKKIKLHLIDATRIAQEVGLGQHVSTVLQAAFFAVSRVIPLETALAEMKEAARRTFFAKGEDVIKMNLAAIEKGATAVYPVEIPEAWARLPQEQPEATDHLPEVVTRLLQPINRQRGDDLPVSAFRGYEDGAIEMGLTAYEKRGIAVQLPQWLKENCLQCNQCALVCPHGVIRPYLLDQRELDQAPQGFETVPAKGRAAEGLAYSLQVSTYDCTGCGSCANTCPAREKALKMVPAALSTEQLVPWNYAQTLSDKGPRFEPYSVKGSQFRTPLLEFSAACAGCGETPYAKLLTQLFGDRIYWANATGCSQAWGSPMPGIPYTTNQAGCGPAWSNSLFENNAEFSLGMLLSVRQQRAAQQQRVQALLDTDISPSLRQAAEQWLNAFDDFEQSPKVSAALIAALQTDTSPLAAEILAQRDQLTKKSFWMFGGDGWAYDIGFGGLDHVVASGEDVKVLIVDTEVYSNTGGQSSKATPIGAVAQFASAGKRSRKKDLGAMLMTYGHVYVAQVAMGADQRQLIQALKEAAAYDGPAVIIAYAPCVAHGIRIGMGRSQEEMKRAVDVGYWLLYRYNPANPKRPLTVDSKAPSLDFDDFFAGETRYAALQRTFPEQARELFAMARQDAAQRYARYKQQEAGQQGDAEESPSGV